MKLVNDFLNNTKNCVSQSKRFKYLSIEVNEHMHYFIKRQAVFCQRVLWNGTSRRESKYFCTSLELVSSIKHYSKWKCKSSDIENIYLISWLKTTFRSYSNMVRFEIWSVCTRRFQRHLLFIQPNICSEEVGKNRLYLYLNYLSS